MLQRLLIFITIFNFSCRSHNDVTVHRGFYFWKSRFELQVPEMNALQNLKTERLYVKFFDVVWNNDLHKPAPVAKINFVQAPPASIELVPVVFITNETLIHANADHIISLASNISHLVASIFINNHFKSPKEIQLDCDWTATTKNTYFVLLKELKKKEFFKEKILSVTIRLHQVKYINEAGHPPADRGLLMCYNMGNLHKMETKNSILDPDVLQQYIGQVKNYPLPLDIALPIFDWWVWYSNNNCKGLVRTESLQGLHFHKNFWQVNADTIINDYSFKKGDWLRYESSSTASIQAAISLLKTRLNQKHPNIILYHLDSKILTNYETADLEKMYSGFNF